MRWVRYAPTHFLQVANPRAVRRSKPTNFAAFSKAQYWRNRNSNLSAGRQILRTRRHTTGRVDLLCSVFQKLWHSDPLVQKFVWNLEFLFKNAFLVKTIFLHCKLIWVLIFLIIGNNCFISNNFSSTRVWRSLTLS